MVDIYRIAEGDLPERLTLNLTGSNGEYVDLHFVSDMDLKDDEERVELGTSHFRWTIERSYNLTIQNIKGEVIYQKEIEVK